MTPLNRRPSCNCAFDGGKQCQICSVCSFTL